tara:strand:- start:209 stop:715 length:507 start_codon:yes stop_codon:yes gene_type:complete
MASRITNGTLTVTITEALTLADADTNDHGVSATNVLSLPNIDEVVKRVVEIPTSEVGLLGFYSGTMIAAGYLAGQFDEANVRYIRITNKDDTNHVMLTFKTEGSAEFAVMLDSDNSFIYCCDTRDGAGVVNTVDAHNAAQTHSLEDLVDITALASSAPVDLEVFVAST